MARLDHKWFEVRNQAGADSAEILIYDQIGRDWFSGDGIAAKDFNESLSQIPKDRPILCRINSVGGNVWDGMAIHSMLNARREFVTCRIDGVAASIASVIALAGHRTIMPANALMMMHAPTALCAGDAALMRECADKLEVHAKAIASVYAAKSGKTPEEMMEKMAQGETWMTGEDALQEGLCDECTAAVEITNSVKDFDFSQFQNLPGILRSNATSKQPRNLMSDTNTTTAPPAPPAPVAATNSPDLQAQLNTITARLETERRSRIEAVINSLVSECRLAAAEAPKAIVRATADESYLEELKVRPQILPGHAPVSSGVEMLGEDVRNVFAGIRQHMVSGPKAVENAAERSAAIGAIYTRERSRIIQVMNAGTNTIDSALKRVTILQETIRAFAVRLLPLRLFSTVFQNVPLSGTDSIVVPYFPLRTDASTDWVAGNGYVASGTTNSSKKTITVNKRKYQPLDYTSDTFRRQPYFNVVELGAQNAAKLGVDVITDILSVITLATYGAAAKNIPAAAYTADDIIDLRGVCNDANWPDMGRGLIVNSSVDTALQKDPSYKLALNIGGTEVIREGRLPNISGFDLAWMPSFPANGESLIGAAVFKSGILAAFCPVDPAPGVRQQLVSYEIVTDPATGIAFNYRHWGDPQLDTDTEVIECAYGYVAGEAAAVKRLTTP